MRKTITFLCVVATLFAVAKPSRLGNWASEPFKGMPRSARTITPKAEIATVVVLEEDFSLFTAGSEQAPDSENVAPEENYRYYVKDEYMHTPGWGGYNVYQAGGACALLKYDDPWYGESYGYIKTPKAELYGTATVTFRARRAHSNPGAGNLDLALCDDSYGRLETTAIQITDEWQQYSWSSTKADFNDRSVFQFTPVEGELLIDDIKVTRVRNRIPGTTAVAPVNNSTTEFVARWNPTTLPDADGYIFNVYYKDMPSEVIAPGSISVDFESINLNAEGNIDAENPGYPEGWSINVSSNGSKDMCTDAGDFNSGRQAINFDSAGDTVISPVTPAPINKISFWIKPSNMNYESGYYSLVGVSIRQTDGKWEHIANIPNYWLNANGGYYEFEGDVIGEYITQVRLTCESSYDVTFAIDDIKIDYATTPVPYALISNELLTDTFRVVSGIDPSKEHFYYVQVKEGELISDPSSDMWVDGILGVTPKALPATDLTATGFTANWEPIHNADVYKLSVEQKQITQSDNEEIVLAYEDFSLLAEGTADNPYIPWTATHSLVDNNQSEQDWILVNPQWASGMAGSRGTTWMGEAGLVVSPGLKLGNNEVKVEVTACSTVPGDTLWVMVMDDYSANVALAGKTIGFSATEAGYTTGTVTFDGSDFGDGVSYVAFMSQIGSAFFIDEAKISVIVPTKGTEIECPFKIINHNENSYTFTGLPEGVRNYSYNVVAKCNKNFMDYISEVSETIAVELPLASVENISVENNCRVYSVDGALKVVSKGEAAVQVYNTCGALVKVAHIGAGENTVPVQQGIYIVKVGDEVHKIVVN